MAKAASIARYLLNEASSSPSVLLVGAVGDVIDDPIVTLLETVGCTVTRVADTSFTASVGNTYDVIVVSETTAGTQTATELALVTVPILCMEQSNWDDLQMSSTGSAAGEQSLNILDNTHYTTNQLSTGTNAVSTAGSLGWATTLGAGATLLAESIITPANKVMFAYETGADLITGTAPARMIALGLH